MMTQGVRRRTFPPGSPFALTLTGGQPVPSVHLASTPSCTSPSTRSWMGRSRMRSTPSRMNLDGGRREGGRSREGGSWTPLFDFCNGQGQGRAHSGRLRFGTVQGG